MPRLNCKRSNFHPRDRQLTSVLVKWCLDNSISSQITTPVSAQDLSSALISALESNTVSPVSAPNDVIFDILLAEDNLVNQKLAVKILEKYGHTVEIAENGSLALDAFKGRVSQNKPFDIILVRIFHSTVILLLRIHLRSDGRFNAIHGRHGGHGTYPIVRNASRTSANAHYRINGSC